MAPTSLLGSLATLLFGIVGLVTPDTTAETVGLDPLDAAGRSEVTTVFGGIFTTLGVLGLAGEERPVTLVWLGIVVARLASFRDREAVAPGPVVALLVEVAILGLFLAPEGEGEPAIEVEVPGTDADDD